MWTSHWRAFLNCRNPDKAQRVLEGLRQRLAVRLEDVELKTDQERGFVVSWRVIHETATWEMCVVEVIALGEQAGSGWVLGGNVRDSPSGVLGEAGGGSFSVSGVTFLSWDLLKTRAHERSSSPSDSSMGNG